MNETGSVLIEVAAERRRQDGRWGQQNHSNHMPGDDAWTPTRYDALAELWKAQNAERVQALNTQGTPSDRNCAWDGVLLEEVFESLAEKDDARVRAELVQVAAVAVAWIEAIDRRAGGVA